MKGALFYKRLFFIPQHSWALYTSVFQCWSLIHLLFFFKHVSKCFSADVKLGIVCFSSGSQEVRSRIAERPHYSVALIKTICSSMPTIFPGNTIIHLLSTKPNATLIKAGKLIRWLLWVMKSHLQRLHPVKFNQGNPIRAQTSYEGASPRSVLTLSHLMQHAFLLWTCTSQPTDSTRCWSWSLWLAPPSTSPLGLLLFC